MYSIGHFYYQDLLQNGIRLQFKDKSVNAGSTTSSIALFEIYSPTEPISMVLGWWTEYHSYGHMLVVFEFILNLAFQEFFLHIACRIHIKSTNGICISIPYTLNVHYFNSMVI